MPDDPKQGHEGRHTPPSSAVEADSWGDRAVDALVDGRDLDQLLAGLPQIDRADVLATAAELAEPEKRGPGRPAGSPNRKNKEMIAYLEARGLRDPWLTLALIHSASTRSLANALSAPMVTEGGKVVKDADGSVVYVGADPLKVLAIQQRAADSVMKYHHAAQPQQLDMPLGGDGYKRPFMAIGELHGNVVVADGSAAMSIFDPPMKTVENQPVSDEDSVRPDADVSHDVAKPLIDNDNPTQSS